MMEGQSRNNRWIRPKEFEEEFGVTMETQSKWRRDKKIPFSKIGGFVFYDRNLIDKWIESHSVGV